MSYLNKNEITLVQLIKIKHIFGSTNVSDENFLCENEWQVSADLKSLPEWLTCKAFLLNLAMKYRSTPITPAAIKPTL